MRGEPVLMSRILAFLALTALALGCDPASYSDGPIRPCTESGAQCQLPDGPLGVCERAVCEAGARAPCFTCTPQH